LATRGAIVNVGSTAGLAGLPYGAAYGASKGAVHALTRAIAVEYARRGLRCNSVCPASIETAMMRPTFPEGVDLRLLQRAASLHGVRGPEVVADLIAFLASDEAIHISGEEIRIDGAALA
jgi:NAD(P)-dependent dehydrogenase (short-subunit alcohol dehydrogenase family)